MSLHIDNETIKALVGLPVSLLTKTEHVTETTAASFCYYYIILQLFLPLTATPSS